MKLLIIDDEELTRNGLCNSINKKRTGIADILLAADGAEGLAIAMEEKPEIILCDIRMPKMDGLTLAERIKSELPQSVIIFMSGYSDKAYLMAAIRLHAVRYVEKPLNMDEVHDAVIEAVNQYHYHSQARKGLHLNNSEYLSRLVMYLTQPVALNLPKIQALFHKIDSRKSMPRFCTAMVANFLNPPYFTNDWVSTLYDKMKQAAAPHCFVLSVRHQTYLVGFLFSDRELSVSASGYIADKLMNELSSIGECYISLGVTHEGGDAAYSSYEAAVILLQSSYYFEPNRILRQAAMPQTARDAAFLEAIDIHFSEYLDFGNSEAMKELLDHLNDYYLHNMRLLPDHAKDMYYKLFDILSVSYRHKRIPFHEPHDYSGKTLIRYLEEFPTYIKMHQTLSDACRHYFASSNSVQADSETVFRIKAYISEHYHNPNLSVKDISEHVYLSVSYICTLFKSETQLTLNQYITDYRIERAKRLLLDARNKMTDIAIKTGYNDSNYFGKSFKKTVGLSPSEFREKMQI